VNPIKIDTPPLRVRLFEKLCDIVLVTAAQPLVLPLVIILLVWSLGATGRPLYRATRIGHQGIEFKVWKIRTLLPKSEIFAWGGAFVRQKRLDELPQLYQVYFGTLSLFMGFRPMTPSDVAAIKVSGQDVESVCQALGPSVSCLNAIRLNKQKEHVYLDAVNTASQRQTLRTVIPFYRHMLLQTTYFVCCSNNTDRNGVRADSSMVRIVSPEEAA
jgi:lipopolysaccharide/colanic/teichoic acid biosynthesis glycosyltransferase